MVCSLLARRQWPLTKQWQAASMLVMLLSVPATSTAAQSTPIAFGDSSTGTPPVSEVAAELPPADLPTTNERGYTFAIEGTLTADLGAVVEEAPVFQLIVPDFDSEDAILIAKQLEIGGTVEERSDDTFSAVGNGELFIAPMLIQYYSPATVRPGDLPSDEEAVAFAREWLRLTGLSPRDLGDGNVDPRIDRPDQVVVLFKPLAPSPLLAAFPAITVSLGANGTILEATLRWADLSEPDLYQLRPAEDAWRQVENGQAYIDVDLDPDAFPFEANVMGTAEYSEISLAYTTSGTPGEDQYLQPVFVFDGEFTPEGGEPVTHIRAYVPALVNSETPVGELLHDRRV